MPSFLFEKQITTTTETSTTTTTTTRVETKVTTQTAEKITTAHSIPLPPPPQPTKKRVQKPPLASHVEILFHAKLGSSGQIQIIRLHSDVTTVRGIHICLNGKWLNCGVHAIAQSGCVTRAEESSDIRIGSKFTGMNVSYLTKERLQVFLFQDQGESKSWSIDLTVDVAKQPRVFKRTKFNK